MLEGRRGQGSIHCSIIRWSVYGGVDDRGDRLGEVNVEKGIRNEGHVGGKIHVGNRNSKAARRGCAACLGEVCQGGSG